MFDIRARRGPEPCQVPKAGSPSRITQNTIMASRGAASRETRAHSGSTHQRHEERKAGAHRLAPHDPPALTNGSRGHHAHVLDSTATVACSEANPNAVWPRACLAAFTRPHRMSPDGGFITNTHGVARKTYRRTRASTNIAIAAASAEAMRWTTGPERTATRRASSARQAARPIPPGSRRGRKIRSALRDEMRRPQSLQTETAGDGDERRPCEQDRGDRQQ